MIALMFHSVGNDQSHWHRRYLSVSTIHFEKFCCFLSDNHYRSVLLDEWYYLQKYPEKETGNEVVLTLDDGYLDNWVVVYPILKKYGLKATVFINPEFVDPINQIRPNLDDILLGNTDGEDLKTLGFLSWPEIQKMDADGVVQAQSHSMSHNFYFCSEKIVDFYVGQYEYDWLAWFMAPDRKPFSISEDQSELVPFGHPVFQSGRALGLRRFFPDSSIVGVLCEKANVFSDKGFEKVAIIKELFKETDGYLNGHYETDQEMEDRFRYELFESRRILEEKVNHPVEYLCWPGGGYNGLSLAMSRDAGYKASTLASRDKNPRYDNSGEYKRISRQGMGSCVYKKERIILAPLANHLVYSFQAQRGKILPRVILKLQQLLV